MGWFSRLFGSSRKNIVSRDLCNDDNLDEETELAKEISKYEFEEHQRMKREEEKEKIEIHKAIKESLKLDHVIIHKTNNIEEDSNHLVKKDSTHEAETKSNISVVSSCVADDKQLGKAVHQDTLKENCDIKQQIPKAPPSPRLCDGCNLVIEENGRFVNILAGYWHLQCLCCLYCNKPIFVRKIEKMVSNFRGHFHRSCYRNYCCVCEKKFCEGDKYNDHEFWEEKYCVVHDSDGTPACCSCERLEAKRTSNVMFEDGRRQCIECMQCAIMDTNECQNMLSDIHEFFEGLILKVPREFPLLLVEKQALNEAEKQEKIDNKKRNIRRGICLSSEKYSTVKIVSEGPRIGRDNKLIGMATKSVKIVRQCEVTAILILYGLPRLLTGSIMAHEMLHAWFRLNGCNPELEEGLCQILAHMWLESQTFSNTNTAASSSSSSSSSYKKEEQSDFERKFVKFCMYQIETDKSEKYGDGFKKVREMVKDSSFQKIINKITHNHIHRL